MGLGMVLVKNGVLFTTIAPAGFRLLGAIEASARELACDLTITSACDGTHAGLNDPHHRGEAYDIRTHGMTDGQKDDVLRRILDHCSNGPNDPALPLAPVARSWATRDFFGFVEKPGTDFEHLHVQLRKRAAYGE